MAQTARPWVWDRVGGRGGGSVQQPLVRDRQPLLCGLPHLHGELTFA